MQKYFVINILKITQSRHSEITRNKFLKYLCKTGLFIYNQKTLIF